MLRGCGLLARPLARLLGLLGRLVLALLLAALRLLLRRSRRLDFRAVALAPALALALALALKLAAAAPGERLDGGRQEENPDEEHRNLHCAENVSAHGRAMARGRMRAPAEQLRVLGVLTLTLTL